MLMAPMEPRSAHVAGILLLDIADCFALIWQSFHRGQQGPVEHVHKMVGW